MGILLKDIYSKQFYNDFAKVLTLHIDGFDKNAFTTQIFTTAFQHYELKARMIHTAKVLGHFMPSNFEQSIAVIKNTIQTLRQQKTSEQSFEYMFMPEYITMFGINDFKNSIAAFEFITQFTSCEFAVRPYIIKYPNEMQQTMLQWAKHENAQVRRLASEGIRPRLPWAMALPKFKKDPQAILPILEILQADTSDSVRRSVANNLNDIAKDNPNIVIDIAKKWHGKNTQTNALLKHACRTLLKQGDPEALQLFGFKNNTIALLTTHIETKTVPMGGYLVFTFEIENTTTIEQKLRLEYAIYYQKKNHTLSKKVYQISEKTIRGQAKQRIKKQHSFKTITTRIFHPGEHRLSIIINGCEQTTQSFQLNRRH